MSRAALVVALVIAAGCGGGRAPREQAPADGGRAVAPVTVAPPADAALAVDASAPPVVLTAVTGRVERLDADGGWRLAIAGEALADQDRLRTGGDGEATMEVAAVGVVVLAPRSDFEVGRRTQELMSLQLGRGRLRADVGRRGRLPLRIAIRGTDTYAQARDGSFSVLTSPAGTVAVAAERGSVEVGASARTVQVEAGAVTVVPSGQAPSPPRALPPSLILKLAHGPREVATRDIVVSGTTTPGAVVTLAAARITTVAAGADGRFTGRVALAEGANRVTVEAIDPVGRTAREHLPVIVDTRPPDVEAEVRW